MLHRSSTISIARARPQNCPYSRDASSYTERREEPHHDELLGPAAMEFGTD
ncbi:hypothetical protein [Nonomuraea aurantiaca]|uniref:hypothetical protein n=1 Tax=Nonomuraea aurantiaca TaxID=2878562 RepID=UPI001CD966F1|nr:hypothetical protein [Nonomuraea aurantiaca]MCA2225274.1 hypothetical protein [Nonomuraea aurantiaca]